MRQAGGDRHGRRLSALIVVLWRAGLPINEVLSLTETDLDRRRGSILVRHGKNDRRREVGMDAWAWTAIGPWLADRVVLPVGPLFCVIDGLTRGRAWSASAAPGRASPPRAQRGSHAPLRAHQLRHAHAVEPMHEGIPLPPIQRQLGDSHLSTTGTYLEGSNTEEINHHRPRQTGANDARQRRPRPLAGTRRERTRAPAPRPLLSSQAAATPQRRC